MTTPAGTFNYYFDAGGRPSSMINPFSETTSWSYQNNNWLSTQTLANGAVATYTHNALGQMTRLLNQIGSTTISDFSSIAYDGVGNRSSVTASIPGATLLTGTTGYSYDSKDQITQETSTRNGGFTDTFGYDSAGNPTSFKGITKTYNSKNQQTATGFSYDGNGNPITYAGTTLTFDPENRMTAYGSVLTAGYNGDGLRGWKQNSNGRTYFVYDGIVPVVELNSSGSVTATNTFGASGLVSRQAGSASVFYSFDSEGNVTQRTDAGGNILSNYLFAAHGVMLSGPLSEPFGYKGRVGYYTDTETGLQLLTHRHYDSNTGRFLTRDPISYNGGINLYAYTNNNPENILDPSGLIGGGLIASGSAELGFGPIGGGATGSIADGAFWGRGRGFSRGHFKSFGAFAGVPDDGPHYPSEGPNEDVDRDHHQVRFVEGAYAGFGGGIFLTNADSICDLAGPFHTWTLNVGVGPVKGSIQFGYNNGIGIVSITGGPGIGASLSGYPTNTWTKNGWLPF